MRTATTNPPRRSRTAPAARTDVAPATLALGVALGAAFALALALAPARLGAQDTAASAPGMAGSRADTDGADPRPDECFGFTFGEWEPPLDWAAARHRVPLARPPGTPSGPRGDASHAGLATDSSLMLYPAWWPAGVLVHFTARNAAGDTLRGIATALVADGRVRAPVSPVTGWKVRCR